MRQISFDDGITYMFGPHLEPVATVRSGETVEFVCQDSCGGQIQSEWDTLDQLQMDRGNGATKEITKGNSVYLPVFQPGGQLAMGDLHALMADGEVCVTGIEIAGTVRTQVDVLRGYGLQRPIVETPEAWLTLASAPTLDDAAKLATHDGVAFLARGADLPWDEAYMLASIACDLRISQDVDPWRTAKLVIPKKLVPRLPTR